MRLRSTVLAIVLLGAAPAPAEEGDPAAGAEAFDHYCRQCHVPVPGDPLAAPDLVGIVGRPVAATAYRHSDAFMAKKAEGMVWTEENLRAFIRSPDRTIPGNIMQFPGVKRGSLRDDIIAYLRSLE